MSRKSIAVFLSGVLVAAGFTLFNAPAASAANNDCVVANQTISSVAWYPRLTAGGGLGFAMTIGGVPGAYVLTATDTEVTPNRSVSLNLTVSCISTYYTYISISGADLTAGERFSVRVEGISKPLAMGTAIGEPGVVNSGAGGSNIYGDVVDIAGLATWEAFITTDSWGAGDDWLGATCAAALKVASADTSVVRMSTVTEGDNAGVSAIDSTYGKLKMRVNGPAGADTSVYFTVPDWYLTNAACGWNLAITGKSDDEVKALVSATYGGAAATVAVTSVANDFSHTFKVDFKTVVASGNMAETIFLLEPKTADNGGGGTTPTTKPAQSTTKEPSIPAKVKAGKKMVVLRSAVMTNAGQTADVAVACSKKLKPCKVKESSAGKVTVSTKKKANGTITVTLSAPATTTFAAYSATKVVKVRK